MDAPPWMAAGVQVWGCALRNPMFKNGTDGGMDAAGIWQGRFAALV
jgi:hypothetical protein